MINKSLSQITNPAIDNTIGGAGLPGSGFGLSDTTHVMGLFLRNFVKLGFIIGSIIFFFMLLWGAFEYITAGGDKDKVGNASKRMSNAMIGMVLLLATYAISRLVNQVFGINLLSLEIPVIQ